MSQKVYPKVLIIGQSFNTNSGGGITLLNLFKGWDPDRVAVASSDIDLRQKDICNNYYQIGMSEEKWAFPFNLFQRKLPSGNVPKEAFENADMDDAYSTTRPKPSAVKEWIKSTFILLLNFIGVYHWVYTYRLSPKLLQWIEDFQPDVIYAQATSLGMIKLTHSVLDKTQGDLAIHIMDDYISTINPPGLLHNYWGRQLDKGFRGLVNRATHLMSICQEMSDEYEIRYGRAFSPYHNPVEIEQWLHAAKGEWTAKNPFEVMYGGRIGIGTSVSLVTIAKAVSKLAEEGLYIYFRVHTFSKDEEKVIAAINAEKNCRVLPPVQHHELPELLAEMDLLVLPIDYDPKGMKYIRLSMPTKCSEYMASGTPNLVFSPKEMAMYKYAEREKWAYTVSENSVDTVAEALRTLYDNEELREQLGTTGMHIAATKHDANIIRDDFRKELLGEGNGKEIIEESGAKEERLGV